MLCELFITNLAVIEKATVEFSKGLNVFTGETGAGKSIVIDAINAVLGQRTSKEIVRHGEQKASITARFSELNEKVISKLSENGFEPENGELIITREIFADAKSTARIMGRPVTVSILKDIGTELITIHGQHDNQILLSPERHMDILDSYGEYSALQEEYLECYRNVVRIKREMKQAAMSEQEKAERIEKLTYQIDEIEKAMPLNPDEEEKLRTKREEIKNSTRILESVYIAKANISGDEQNDLSGGALESVQLAVSSIEKVSELFENGDEIYSAAIAIQEQLTDLSDLLSRVTDRFDVSPQELELIDDRLAILKELKRKYGETESDIIKYCDDAKAELEALSLSEQYLLELNEKAQTEYARLLKLADKLTASRKSKAEQFVKSVSDELVFLDMPSVKLEVKIDHVKPNSKGQDNVEFLISTNAGEPPKPIAKIASGGELSRIMLAIKNTLADKDDIQTLIFDEIDTGVSGRAAQKIGLKLKQAAKNRQILSVTHLAQIAALADHHLLISKRTEQNHTFTTVNVLDIDGRVEEVARIMSTDVITDLMRQNAREMIEKGS